jgi:hypothetical protein
MLSTQTIPTRSQTIEEVIGYWDAPLPDAFKHLPGQHDQQTHDPTKGVHKLAASTELKPPGGGQNVAPDFGLGSAFDLALGSEQTMDPSEFMAHHRIKAGLQSEAFDEICNNLVEKAGLSYHDADALLGLWASYSNDDDVRSMSLHEAVAEEFGGEMTDWQKANLQQALTKRGWSSNDKGNKIVYAWDDNSNMYPFEDAKMMSEFTEGFPPEAKSKLKKALHTMYDETQKRLEENGIEYVKLYRTIGHPRDTNGNKIKANEGDVIKYKPNAMESWSLSYTTARYFPGATVVAIVPRSRILSIPKTGFGCLRQLEFVVMGKAGVEDSVEVVSVKKPKRVVQ